MFWEAIPIAVLAGATWRLASPAFDTSFRRLFPVPARVMLGLALLATFVIPIVVVAAPILGIVAAVIVSFVVATFALRTVLGRFRNEPPGSRSPVTSTRDLAHRDSYTRRFERHGPIVLSSQFGRTVVCILGIERGQKLLREHRPAIGPSPLAFSQQMMGGFLRYMDDDTHDFYGPLFRRAMSRAVTEESRPIVKRLVEREIASVPPSGVDPRPMNRRICEEVLLHSLFGVDPESAFGRDFLDALRSFAGHSIHHRANRAADRDLERVRQLVRKTVSESSQSGTKTSVSALSEIRSLDANQPDGVAVDNLLFMWRIGAANTASLLAWTLQHVGAHPEFRSRISRGESGLPEAVVMESLRLSQSEYVYRRLKKSVEFEGFTLRKGWTVRICVAESHLDPKNFVCPHDFTDRFLGDRPAQSVYSPFGFDRHACNSGGLASMIAATALETLLSDARVDIVPSRSLRRDLRHWSHWQPGADLSLTRATN